MSTYIDSEQMLSEVISILMDKHSISDPHNLKNNLSTILINYEVKKVHNLNNNSDIPKMIELFVSAKRLEGLSENTLNGYITDLSGFAKHINKNVESITSSDIRYYLSQYPNNAMSTISKKLSTVKSFFSWLTVEEVIPKNPTLKVKLPKLEKRLPNSLSIEELEMLRENCKTIRMKAILECYYSSGARLSELMNLNIEDIDFAMSNAKVIGKGNKQRIVNFGIKAMHYLKKYLNERNDDCEALFVTERKPHRRMQKRTIQKEFKKIMDGVKCKHSVSPKLMRSTFAMLTLNQGADIHAVQSMLGHESPSTTMRYARITEDRKREQHKKYLIQ